MAQETLVKVLKFSLLLSNRTNKMYPIKNTVLLFSLLSPLLPQCKKKLTPVQKPTTLEVELRKKTQIMVMMTGQKKAKQGIFDPIYL